MMSLFSVFHQDSPNRYITLKEDGGPRALRFEKLQTVGEGTFGTVYKVKTSDGNLYALKVGKFSNVPQHICEIAQETRVLHGLKDPTHPGIVRYHGYGIVEENNKIKRAILLDLKKGSLGDLLKNGGGFRVEAVRLIAKQLAEALKYLKEKRVVHTDIKPPNVLFDTDSSSDLNSVCLADVGGGLEFNDEGKSQQIYSTLWYIPPEGVMEVAPPDFPTDVWALACLIFEVATSRPLFPVEAFRDPLNKRIEFRGGLIPLHEGSCDKKYPPRLLENASLRGKQLYNPSLIKEDDLRSAQQKCIAPIEDFEDPAQRRKDRMEGPFSRRNPGEGNKLDDLDNLLGGMLEFDPHKRMTPEGMLAHPFVTGGRV